MELASNPALSSLQSEAQVELLDAIDKLRVDSLSGELDLPHLIVCGKQSCGKSSVLEAISQVRFPAADTACTRFATELVLRKASNRSMLVKLMPGPCRNNVERGLIADFQAPEELIDAKDLEGIIKAAEKFIDDIDYPESGSTFYQDKLQVTVFAPDHPRLTLVDLPGLIRTREHGTENIDVVEDVVVSYMREKSSIILAVVTADDDLANQGVLELAKSYDPEGSRTMGILTKPDRTEAGSPAENAAIMCAQNVRFPLGLGWHVLKNRGGHAHRNDTSEARDDAEEAFFNASQWSVIPEAARGIKSLRKRLSEVLLQSIATNLPALVNSIREKVFTCEDKLRKLGVPKSTEQEQRMELTAIGLNVQNTVKSSLDGHYDGDFFHNSLQHNASVRQLRSRLRSILDHFSKRMEEDGHYYDITETPDQAGRTANFSTVPTIAESRHRCIQISPQAAELAAGEYIKANRGLEPPGFPPSGAVAHMFRVQASPWRAIAEDCIEECWQTSVGFFVNVLQYFAVPHIAQAIWKELAGAKLAVIRRNLDSKLEELLRPYKKGYPIILDISRSLRHVGDSVSYERPMTDDYVAWRALGCLDTYYKVAVATFPETVATLAIENCLVDGLLDIFTPVTVASLNAEALCSLTAEPEHIATQRVFNQKRLSALRDISVVFSRYSVGFNGYEVHHSQSEFRQQDDSSIPTGIPSSQIPAIRLDENESGPSVNNIRDVLTPPKTPKASFSRASSSSSPIGAGLIPQRSNGTDNADGSEASTRPRRSTSRRKANGVPRSLAQQSSVPRWGELVGPTAGVSEQVFAEDTSDSEL